MAQLLLKTSFVLSLLAGAQFVWAGETTSNYSLVGVEFDTGDVYSISTTDASVSLIANTGLDMLGSLEMTDDGRLFGFTTSGADTPSLYEFDPITYAPTYIGALTEQIVFDGSLVFGDNGSAYGTNRGSVGHAQLFSVDLNTGESDIINTITVDGDSRHDINGMAMRSDGMLVGLDRASNSLLAIDPVSASATVINSVNIDLGTVGGMTVIDGVGYFNTGGPGSLIPGSNELYSFDLFTGQYDLIGNFGSSITGVGFSGLATVPEPATLAILAAGLGMAARRKRRTS